MREDWDKALDIIDEKYISETAESLSKHSDIRVDDTGRTIRLTSDDAPKKGKKGLFVGVSAAAAALACAVGVGFWLNRGELPTNSNESEISSEISGTSGDNSYISEAVDTVEPFDPADYEQLYTFYEYNGEQLKMELDEYMLSTLTEIFSTYEEIGEPTVVDNYKATLSVEEDICYGILAEDSILSGVDMTKLVLTSSEDEKYGYGMLQGDSMTHFGISQEFYDELDSFMMNYIPQLITATVEEVEGGGSYIAGGIRISTDIPLAVGDEVNIYYYGEIMETYPAQVNEYFIEKVRGYTNTETGGSTDNGHRIELHYNIDGEAANGSQIVKDLALVTYNENGGFSTESDHSEIGSGFYRDSELIYKCGINGDSGTIPADTNISLMSISTEKGILLIAFVPTMENGELLYYPVVFFCTQKGELTSTAADLDPMPAVRLYNNRDRTVISYKNTDGTVSSYNIDYDGKELYPSDPSAEISRDITADIPEEGFTRDNMMIYAGYFFGEWGNKDKLIDLTLTGDSLFSMADPCLGMTEDKNGYFMYADDGMYFIPKNDYDVMFYFKGAKDGETLNTAHCTECYNHVGVDGFNQGSLPLGYFGMWDIAYYFEADISELFDMEFTDENGTRWIRTNDYSIDWGKPSSIYVNDKHAYLFKMMNADDPTEMAYFTFETVGDEAALLKKDTYSGEESWLNVDGEHYRIDERFCELFGIITDQYSSVMNSVSDSQYGMPTVGVNVYTTDEGYYVHRNFGNTMSQWLSSGDLFYVEGDNITTLDEFWLLQACTALDNRLYMLKATGSDHYDEDFVFTCYEKGESLFEKTFEGLSSPYFNIRTYGRYVVMDIADYESRIVVYDTVTEQYAYGDSDTTWSWDDEKGFSLYIGGNEYCVTNFIDGLAAYFEG